MTVSAAKPSSKRKPHVGLIVPPKEPVTPLEATTMYGDSVRFTVRGLGVTELTSESFDIALKRLDSAIVDLVAEEVDSLSLMGTSISFYRGNVGHDKLVQQITNRAGLIPISTMSLAIVRALQTMGIKRVAIGSPYTSQIAATLNSFLTFHGFDVVGSYYLGLASIPAIVALDDQDLVELGESALSNAPTADALVLSCGALHTAQAVNAISARRGKPVMSSSQAGCWDAVRLANPSIAGSTDFWTGLSNIKFDK